MVWMNNCIPPFGVGEIIYALISIRWECRERFPRHRGLAILTCIRHVRNARAVMHAGIAN